jgi:hypothetical protein
MRPPNETLQIIEKEITHCEEFCNQFDRCAKRGEPFNPDVFKYWINKLAMLEAFKEVILGNRDDLGGLNQNLFERNRNA